MRHNYYDFLSRLPSTALSPVHSGPVRHFMELVVTGLSKNPHYSAQEKREYVQWYRKYFSNFTPEELQSVGPQSASHQAE